MHLILLAVGTLMVIIGIVLIRYGVPLDEYGNSPLLMSGMVALVGGLILIALASAVRGINRIAERLDIQPLPLPPVQNVEVGTPRRMAPIPLVRAEPPPDAAPKVEPPSVPVVPAPDRPPAEATAEKPAETKPAEKPSLLGGLFGRSRRTPSAPVPRTEPPAPAAAPVPEAAPAPPPPTPGVDLEPLTRMAEPEPPVPVPAPPPAPASSSAPPKSVPPSGAAVYKSGVIDGMAYTLYTDGSIEAELAQGRVRFATVEDLQNYLLKR